MDNQTAWGLALPTTIALAAVAALSAVGLASPLVGIVVVVAFTFWPHGQTSAEELAAAEGVTITDASRQFITRYLETGRRLRMRMVWVAVIASNVVMMVRSGRVGLDTTWLVAGGVGAVVLTELQITRPTGPTARASLVPRRLDLYLGAPLRYAPLALALANAAAVVALLMTAQRPEVVVGRGDGLLAAVLWMPALAAIVAALQRWIVRRPQPVVTPDVVAADDACRAVSIKALAYVAVAMGFLGLAIAGLYSVDAYGGATEWVAGVAGYVCLWCAACAWRARRPPRRRALVPCAVPAA